MNQFEKNSAFHIIELTINIEIYWKILFIFNHSKNETKFKWSSYSSVTSVITIVNVIIYYLKTLIRISITECSGSSTVYVNVYKAQCDFENEGGNAFFICCVKSWCHAAPLALNFEFCVFFAF